MLIYKIVRVPVEYCPRLERLVTEALNEGWELAGSMCMISRSFGSFAYLAQPMIKKVVTRAEWLDGSGIKRC